MLKIDTIHLDSKLEYFIDKDKFPTYITLLTRNLRGKVKSVKEIIYKEQHSKFLTPLEIESEKYHEFSVFGDIITNYDLEYDSYGQKTKCYSYDSKIISEYKHTYDQNNNCTETNSFENGVLVENIKYRFKEGILHEKTITKIEGTKRTNQIRIQYDYINGQIVEKKYKEISGNSLIKIRSQSYWYDENKKLVKESYWICSYKPSGMEQSEINEIFQYDKVGRLIKIGGDSFMEFIYSENGNLLQIETGKSLAEFDEKGNCISKNSKNREDVHVGYIYEYDSFNNWIKRTERRVTPVPESEERYMDDADIINMNAPRIIVKERKIEYYK
jgi:hypothetical protein